MENLPDRSQLRTWFAFALRILGVWELLTAASYFFTGLNISAGLTKPMAGTTSFGSVMTHVFGHLILSLWLLKGAAGIAGFFYPDPPPIEDTAEKTRSESDS
jgi:hypothetical protein